MKYTIATLTLKAVTPYSQSFKHSEPKKDGESHEDYDLRTCMSKCHFTKDDYITIPSDGWLQCMTAGAKYSGRQIEGQGKKTWTAKFQAGLALPLEIVTNVHRDNVKKIDIFANSDGVRGSGKRVPRRFPMIFDWEATFPVMIVDPIITPDVFTEILAIAGMFIGIGRYRPEKGGSNGRFELVDMVWEDNRELKDVLNKRKK